MSGTMQNTKAEIDYEKLQELVESNKEVRDCFEYFD
jgi:hypothetical protein